MQQSPRPDYGIDAPGLVRMFFVSGAIAAALALGAAVVLRSHPPAQGIALTILGFVACYGLGMGSFMLYESRIGKVRGREAILDQVDWHGNEQVLDVGCGRGLLLVGAARRLSTGRAIGVDIWQASDQSANDPAGAAANAALEGVADRVDIRTADMRSLPFADAAFDVVLSHWAVHNLEAAADRHTALAEMARVLRPGGTLILTDIAHRGDYADQLSRLGFDRVRIVVDPTRDAILNAVSFGSFRPATTVAGRPV